MKRALSFSLAAFLLSLPAFAQETTNISRYTDYSINRYTVFTGFDYMISPARNLTERGVEGDFGVTVKPWLGLGADFSAIGDQVFSGAGTINGSETIFAPKLTAAEPFGAPPPSAVHVPFRSTSYTFAVGPQLYYRKFRKVTFIARPGLGMIHETADISFPAQVGGLFPLIGAVVPNPHQTDTAAFFGLGGGFDLKLSRHFAIRFAADWVNTHLFSNLLTNRQNYVRFSLGPTFRWGRLKSNRG
jgi:hypothetical protein